MSPQQKSFDAEPERVESKLFCGAEAEAVISFFGYRKVQVLCFALPVLHLKGQINLLHYSTFCLLNFFKYCTLYRSELELEPEPPHFSRLRLQLKGPQHCPKHRIPGYLITFHWSSYSDFKYRNPPPTFSSVALVLEEVDEANHPGSSSVPILGHGLNVS